MHVSIMATQDARCHVSKQCSANLPIMSRLRLHYKLTSSRFNAGLELDAPSDDKEAMLGKISDMEEHTHKHPYTHTHTHTP